MPFGGFKGLIREPKPHNKRNKGFTPTLGPGNFSKGSKGPRFQGTTPPAKKKKKYIYIYIYIIIIIIKIKNIITIIVHE